MKLKILVRFMLCVCLTPFLFVLFQFFVFMDWISEPVFRWDGSAAEELMQAWIQALMFTPL